jgi:hypothetical protein
MGIRSQLIIPERVFNTRNDMALGWFLLVERKDLVSNIEGCESRVEEYPQDDLYEENFDFRTNVNDALRLLERRLAGASIYFKELLKLIEPMREALQRSPPDGEVILDCSEFISIGDDMAGFAQEVWSFPEKLENAIATEDIEGFNDLLDECGFAGVELTGDVQADIESPMEEYDIPMHEVLIGM